MIAVDLFFLFCCHSGGSGGIFSTSVKPAEANPFGVGSSTQVAPPAFGSTRGSAPSPFGATPSAKSAFGNPAPSNVFGGTGAAGQSIFGQSSGVTKDQTKPPTLGFGASGTSGNTSSGFGQLPSAGTSSLPKPTGFGASNATSTTGNSLFLIGAVAG